MSRGMGKRHGPAPPLVAALLFSGLATGTRALDPLLAVVGFEKYPGYTGPLVVTGRVEIGAVGGGHPATQAWTYRLEGADPACVGGASPPPSSSSGAALRPACGLRAHAGSSCSAAGDHFWNETAVGFEDPWVDVVYSAEGDGAAGSVDVAAGLAIEALVNKTVVVHDAQGRRAACGKIEATDEHFLMHGCYSERQWREQSWLNFTGAFERCGPELICIQGHARCEEYCSFSEECERYPLRLCDEATRKCRHKQLFEGAAGADVAAVPLFFVISGLALSAGIGGGGLYVPLLMMILGFSVREATALSQACLAGGGSTAFVYSLRQRHPSKVKPMIDYNTVLIMGPNLLIGAIVGNALNASAPSWLILLILTVVLTHSAIKTMRKALKVKRQEDAERGTSSTSDDTRLSHNPIERCLRCCLSCFGRERYAQFDDAGAPHSRGTDGGSSNSGSNSGSPPRAGSPSAVSCQVIGASDDPQGAAVGGAPSSPPPAEGTGEDGATAVDHADIDMEFAGAAHTPGQQKDAGDDVSQEGEAAPAPREKRQYAQFPKTELAMLVSMWAVAVLSIFARGGRASPGMVSYCSFWYWLLAPVTATALVSISLCGACRAMQQQKARGFDSEGGELVWTKATVRRIALWSLGAGTLAAMCGIGGGMIMGPILLDLGMLPQVQSSTTGTTLFVMSTSTALAFIVQGVAPPGYALFFASATGLGAIAGKACIGWLVKRLRRPSLSAFLLGGIISASVVVMGITGGIDVANDIRLGKDMLFQGFCSVDGDDASG
mmetsp:Transcript_136879/g.355298  ORF Transcript_136879/g.355298 Transcript_136879/m.355298 type:complete len:778 (-) Transcript_136879:33-2366(-)